MTSDLPPWTATAAEPAALKPIQTLAMTWRQPPPPGCDLNQRGRAYLAAMGRLAPVPEWVDQGGAENPGAIAEGWLGLTIHRLNQALQQHLEQCQDCLLPAARLPAVVFAVPLVRTAGIKGCCCPSQDPVVLLVDVGQAHPQDWLGIVAHEYAHGIAHRQAQGEGHGPAFQQAIAHLCLGLGLLPPPLQAQDPTVWQIWPPCRRPSPPSAFWSGTQSSPSLL